MHSDAGGVRPPVVAMRWMWVVAATSGPDGDRLAATTHVQRIATTGGLTPPASECTADDVGEQRSVPYTADYVFWKQTGAAA